MVCVRKTKKHLGKNGKTKKVQRGGVKEGKIPKTTPPDLQPPRIGSKQLTSVRTNFKLKNSTMQSNHNRIYHLPQTQKKTFKNKVKSFLGLKSHKISPPIYESYKAQTEPELYGVPASNTGNTNKLNQKANPEGIVYTILNKNALGRSSSKPVNNSVVYSSLMKPKTNFSNLSNSIKNKIAGSGQLSQVNRLIDFLKKTNNSAANNTLHKELNSNEMGELQSLKNHFQSLNAIEKQNFLDSLRNSSKSHKKQSSISTNQTKRSEENINMIGRYKALVKTGEMTQEISNLARTLQNKGILVRKSTQNNNGQTKIQIVFKNPKNNLIPASGEQEEVNI